MFNEYEFHLISYALSLRIFDLENKINRCKEKLDLLCNAVYPLPYSEAEVISDLSIAEKEFEAMKKIKDKIYDSYYDYRFEFLKKIKK